MFSITARYMIYSIILLPFNDGLAIFHKLFFLKPITNTPKDY